MSRIGRKPITVPAGVEVKIEGNNLSVKGPKGALAIDFHPNMAVAFENGELLRLREPKNYLYEMPYHIRRKEIDLNGHLHNLCYLDIALEALPDDVYHSRDFKDIRITYRKEIKADEKDITCKYTEENGTHIVGIYGNNGTLRAIVALS